MDSISNVSRYYFLRVLIFCILAKTLILKEKKIHQHAHIFLKNSAQYRCIIATNVKINPACT